MEITPDKLAAFLSKELSLNPEGIHLESTVSGKFNQTWFVTSPELDGDRVLRVAPSPDRSRMLFYEHLMMRQEPAIHDRILGHTSCPVPSILHHGREEPRLDGRDYLLMERLDGSPIDLAGGSAMPRLGAGLCEVHDRIQATPGNYGYLGEHRPMAPQPTWQEAFRDMWIRLLDDIHDCGGHDAPTDRFYRDLLDRHIDMFDHFHSPASLLHMDVWAENILVDRNGNLTGLVDWDRACWGDPEIEFAILDYCGISTPGFWSGYAPDGHDPRSGNRDAAVRRIFYLLYEAQKYIVIRIVRNGDPGGAERYRRMAQELAAQLR